MLPVLLSLAALPFGAHAFSGYEDAVAGDVKPSGLIQFSVKGQKGGPLVKNSHAKRQTTVDIDPKKQGTLYTIDLVVGTPGEVITVQFDTGSDELWVNPVCARSFDPKFCGQFNQYRESSTFQDLATSGGIQYGNGFVDFDYGADYVEIGCKLGLYRYNNAPRGRRQPTAC